jgi:membrane protein DedA with SNARE-associated domain
MAGMGVDLEFWAGEALRFIGDHAQWAGPVLFLLAFGESLAFLSLLLPATAVLVGAGGLIAAGALDFWVVMLWAAPGAWLGDAVSYWIGRHCGDSIAGMWPFRSRPALIENGRSFFERHGGKSVFIGRFFGPVRAVIPLVAGMMKMPERRFQFFNASSSVVWVPMLLAPGMAVGLGVERLGGLDERQLRFAIAGMLLAASAGLMLWWLRARRKA